MKYILSIYLLTATCCFTFAQTGNSTLIADLYQRASQFYEEDKLTECLTLLEKAEQLASAPDAKILYLKIKTLQPLAGQNGQFAAALEKSFSQFFEVAKQQNYPPAKIQEISNLQQTIASSKKIEKTRAENAHLEVATIVDQTMVLIEGGSYKMGSKGHWPAADEKPLHKVTLSNFYLSKYEVTQQLWQKVMGDNPSTNKDCPECPVETVSWNQVQEFIKKLNEMTGKTYRLPTEAEWEYVRKGGQKSNGTTYGGSNNIEETSWTKPNSGGTTHPVGKKAPNELGIYDIVGNVMEWVQDGYDANYYKNSPELNPVNSTDTNERVVRGFSYFNKVYEKVKLDDFGTVIINTRATLAPTKSDATTGFRLARSE
ncbi:formylglycine-generating enzyme family protein [Larkinella sp. GY13]|uniref:formylglycine-generating enzyme family protein n=1 Tax=Larkinella sp. GY13 TaxID=3453720 RepID=UPI003EEC251D